MFLGELVGGDGLWEERGGEGRCWLLTFDSFLFGVLRSMKVRVLEDYDGALSCFG